MADGGKVHILRSNLTGRPWWRADQRLDMAPDRKVWCDCCNAWSPAAEAEARLLTVELPKGDWGDYQDGGQGFLDVLGYCDESRFEVRCASGHGCTVNPRRRASAHLRMPG